MFDTLLEYLLKDAIMFSCGIATIDEDIVQAPDIFFSVIVCCMHNLLE